MPEIQGLSSFGQLLKIWRKKRGFSQLVLAERTNTTVRHLSFIETGRSRPGLELVTRISEALDLNRYEGNQLLASAGFPTQYDELDADNDPNGPYLSSVQIMLDRHDPYPACAVDTLSRIKFANQSFRRIFPELDNQDAEQSIDDFFGSARLSSQIENWDEVAWAFIDRRQLEAVRTKDPRLLELSERAIRHMEGIERPSANSFRGSLHVDIRFRAGDQIISTYMTVMRYESVGHAVLSDLRLEFIFPKDEAAAEFFRGHSEARN